MRPAGYLEQGVTYRGLRSLPGGLFCMQQMVEEPAMILGLSSIILLAMQAQKGSDLDDWRKSFYALSGSKPM